MKQILKENILKNILIVVILILIYFPIHTYTENSSFNKDNTAIGNVIIAVSLFSVCACFGNFGFTYEKINPKNRFQRIIAHTTTGLLMLVLGITLMFTAELIFLTIGYFILIHVIVFLLYIACIGYDFWDLYRLEEEHKK
ncbi:MAG: hypothetical protein WC254_05390 [Candidatus Woesearchaeota archaeon]|jgi:hypothetical protein